MITRWWIASWALAALVSGCGRGSLIPTDTYYRLAPPQISTMAAPLTQGTIYVAPLTSDSLYRERPLLYSENATELAIKQYHYHSWEESPPRLLRQQLVQFLRSAQAAATVTYEVGSDADLSVRGRINRFEHILGKDAVIARVALELRLVDRDGRTLIDREYALDRPAAARDVASVVAATSEAVNAIFAQFLDDARRAAGARKRAP